ncbi:CTP synthase [Dirofilaria immitis]
MFQLQQCFPFLLLLSITAISLQVYGSSLDCNFNWKSCCWRNNGDGAPWQIYRSKIDDFKNQAIPTQSTFDRNKSGQYFLATSVTPNVRYSSDWTSCVTCSRTGQVTVLIKFAMSKAYQLPRTRMKLCWKYLHGKNSIYRYCTFLPNWNFTNYTSKKFTVSSRQPIQFYIKLHNHGKSTALAIINSIKVIIDECYQPFISRSKQQPMKLVATERFREKEILRIRPINTRNKIRKTLIAETSTIQSTNLNSSFLLRDIFGDAFAKFLEDDSDGLIGNQRQFSGDIENRQKQVYKKNNNQNNEPFILTTTTTTTTLIFI